MNIRRDEMIRYYKSLIEEKLAKTLNEKKQAYVESIMIKPIYTNITIEFSRVYKIRYRNIPDTDVDPDELMKKPKLHYKKDSVLFKLNEVLKKQSRHSAHASKSREKHMFYTHEDVDEQFDIDIEDDNIEELEQEIFIKEEDDYDHDDDEASVHVDPDFDDNEIVDDVEENTSTEDENTMSENALAEKKEIEASMFFYKRLLLSKGYNFIDENYVLQREIYIN
jgi:hypothetical protein